LVRNDELAIGSFGGLDYQHGTGRVLDNSLRDTAEKEPLQSAMTMAGQYDEVEVTLLGKFTNIVARVSVGDVGGEGRFPMIVGR
jgi:hypothetical protein